MIGCNCVEFTGQEPSWPDFLCPIRLKGPPLDGSLSG